MERINGLRIGIINVGTCLNKEEEIVEMMKRRKLDIIGLSETREKKCRRTFIHDNYLFIGSGETSGRHGVAIILREQLTSYVSRYSQVNNRIMKISIKTRQGKIALMRVYAPQQGRPQEEKENFYQTLQQVADSCDVDEDVVVMGDLNGHVGTDRQGYEACLGHFSIGDRNDEGQTILDFCIRNNLKIMNTYFQHQKSHKFTWYGWNSTLQRYHRETMIDMFLVSNTRTVRDVKATPSESLDADHRLVILKTKVLPFSSRPNKKIKRVNINALKAEDNQLEFMSSFNRQKELAEHDSTNDINTEWKKMTASIHKAVEETVGYKYSSLSRKRKTPWWNDDVKTAVKNKTKAFRKWMKSRMPRDREMYENDRNICTNIKRQAKKRAWESICSDLEKDLKGNKKLIYHLAKSFRKGNPEKVYNIKDSDTEELLTMPADIDEAWKNYFSNLLNPTDPNQERIEIHPPTENDVNLDVILEEEVERAVRVSKNGKAPGTDLICNELYKLGTPLTTSWLTKIFDQAYKSGKVPDEWGQAIICPIYKNKGDRLKCENYRGISLLNHATKVYEYILERKLRDLVEEKLGPWQHGFRSNRSTKDMIFTLRRIADKHWEFNRPLYIAFIDLEKAFDRVPRGGLWSKLNQYGIPQQLQRAITSLYRSTTNTVRTGNDAELWFETTAGVRQGSVLSPLLFILYLDLVIKEVAKEQRTTNILAYADDIAQLATTEDELQNYMTLWDNTLSKYGLKMNRKKTEILVINRGHLDVTITIGGSRLNQVKTFKYLGSTISEDGLIDVEINNRIKIMAQNIGLLYRLLKDQNVPKKVKKILHTGILRPTLLYGSETWNINKRNMAKLVAADMRIVRLIHGVTIMDKIRNETLCELVGITPLDVTIKNSQIRYYGHIRRREEEHPTQLALTYKVDGTRPTGRPRKRWHQYVDDYLKERGSSLDKAIDAKLYLDRDEWRKLCESKPTNYSP